jgi:4'-phosphopantetheinyl transferase
MPLFHQKNIANNIKVGVWHITENQDDLIKQSSLLNIDLTKLPVTKSESRIKQWISTRLLLSHFFKDIEIIYDELGKPSLSNHWNISISHSGDYVAIILNEKENCGIDIEKISTKVERIKHKFLNENDLKIITSHEHLTLYWGAKEALYKYYGKKEVLFIENLFINSFSNESNYFEGIINMPDLSKEIKMVWDKIDNYLLVYTL